MYNINVKQLEGHTFALLSIKLCLNVKKIMSWSRSNGGGGAIAQLVRPLTVTPEVPGSILGNTLWIFQRYFNVSHLPRGVLVRNPGNL